ncbi:cardiolipin synthase [Paenibacillus marinisediminis]
MIWLIGIVIIYMAQLLAIIAFEYKHPSKTVAWLLISLCIPCIGFIMYYFLAQDYSARRRVKKRWYMEQVMQQTDKLLEVKEPSQMTNAEMRQQQRLFKLIEAMSDSQITGCNQTKVLTNGHDTFEAMIAAIRGAKHHIHFEFYILRDDAIGTLFQNLLIEKVREGVKVRVMTDGVGSIELRQRYITRFKEAGVEFHWFLPVWVSFFRRRLNYRNHRKILVVDGIVGFLGGMNIGDEYVGRNEKTGFWRDTHLQIEGDSVYSLQAIFLHDWALASSQRLDEPELFPKHTCRGKEQLKLVPSGPDTSRDAIQELYFGTLNYAKERVWIATPYFIPDPGNLLAIKSAALSGIDVRIIIPEQSDSKVVDWASRSYLEELMQAGVKFYAYQHGFIHAKTVVMDRALACVGTANMDMRSFFSNFELNAVLFDDKTIERVERDFLMDYENCTPILYEEFIQRGRGQKLLEVLSRLLSPLL